MAKTLSSYWVKFFTGAGFPLDVATKHAVVFSNNRIKPDMLPDLDKPSLKEMGITLMGDMIAILRYAKKVSEEMTCQKFLVDTDEPVLSTGITKTVKAPVKKAVSKVTTAAQVKPSTAKSSTPARTSVKPVKPATSSINLNSAQTNKTSVIKQAQSRLIPDDKLVKKRKIVVKPIEIEDSESEEEWSEKIQKRIKVTSDNGTVGYKVVASQPTDSKTKKSVEQKRTVFDRLGDSSVTSTTSTTNASESNTTFNVTGLGDVVKRNSSVFNRLGGKDSREEASSAGILRNGTKAEANGKPQGILKSKVSNMRSTTVKLKPTAGTSSTGTMRADYETHKPRVSNSVRQLVRSTKELKLNKAVPRKLDKKLVISTKLASDRKSLPAKARLGSTGGQKTVTFNRVTTVQHIKKPGVFSRLGV